MIYRSLPSDVRRNIVRLNIIKFSKWFSLIMPIVVPFYQENHLTITEIMVLKSVYSVAVVLLELPSGYLADVLGRKKTLVAGSFLAAVGFIVYSISHSYIGFLIAEVALAAGHSFVSGADSAMLFDTLAYKNRHNEYSKYEGLNASVGNFSEAFAGLIGGALALISLRLPFIFQALIAASAVPAAITLFEPHLPEKQKKKSSLRSIASILYSIVFKEKDLRFNLLFSSIIGAATLQMAWFAQPLFQKMFLPLALYGTVWTALNLITGGSSIFAHRVERYLGERISLIGIAVFIPLFMMISGIVPMYLIIPLLVIFYFLRGIATPVLKDYINRHTESKVRATVMSLRDLTIRVFFAIFAPLAGYFTDHHNLGSGLAVSGGIFFILSVSTLMLFFVYRKSGSDQNKRL